jgi:hypothetical protein
MRHGESLMLLLAAALDPPERAPRQIIHQLSEQRLAGVSPSPPAEIVGKSLAEFKSTPKSARKPYTSNF